MTTSSAAVADQEASSEQGSVRVQRRQPFLGRGRSRGGSHRRVRNRLHASRLVRPKHRWLRGRWTAGRRIHIAAAPDRTARWLAHRAAWRSRTARSRTGAAAAAAAAAAAGRTAAIRAALASARAIHAARPAPGHTRRGPAGYCHGWLRISAAHGAGHRFRARRIRLPPAVGNRNRCATAGPGHAGWLRSAPAAHVRPVPHRARLPRAASGRRGGPGRSVPARHPGDGCPRGGRRARTARPRTADALTAGSRAAGSRGRPCRRCRGGAAVRRCR
ncbi:hypothetical protein SUDANB58_04338 [Streptomyces sp. enrichment culture]